LKFDDEKIREVIQVQEKLHVTYGRNRRKVAIGIYPYEKIKTPIYFRAEEPKKIKFRPLEFPSELTADKMLQRHPAGREYGYLLEGMEKFPVFRDANGKVLSVPPIINSHDTGKITDKTRDVFIECSGFDFYVLRKCLNMIVTAFADMGGEIYSMQLIYPNNKYISPDLTPEKIKLNVNYVNRILGLDLKEGDIKKYLERMGYEYKNKIAYIPTYRTDVMHQIDLVEDIAIAYGYENLKEEIPNIATIGEESKFHKFKNKIADIFVGLGFIETSTYSLTNNRIQNLMMNTSLDLIEVKNPSSKDFSKLRVWVLPSLMQVLMENKHHDYPQKLFEMGVIFKKSNKSDTETKTEENTRLTVVICESKTDFTQIKQEFDVLMSILNLEYVMKEIDHDSFIPGRVARVSVKNKEVAYIGELHPKIIENFGLKFPVTAFELNLTELYKLL